MALQRLRPPLEDGVLIVRDDAIARPPFLSEGRPFLWLERGGWDGMHSVVPRYPGFRVLFCRRKQDCFAAGGVCRQEPPWKHRASEKRQTLQQEPLCEASWQGLLLDIGGF